METTIFWYHLYEIEKNTVARQTGEEQGEGDVLVNAEVPPCGRVGDALGVEQGTAVAAKAANKERGWPDAETIHDARSERAVYGHLSTFLQIHKELSA